jgi:hypothetical protein
MGPEKRETKRKEPQFIPHESFLERMTGSYTDIAIAGVLFLLVLIVLTVALFRYEKHSQMILTGLLTAFGSLGGFVAGKKTKRKKK